MDTRLALMCGIDYPVPECQLVIHQPKIREIAYIGEEDFFSGIQCLCLNKSMFIKDKTALLDTTNFQIFMMIMAEKEAIDKKKSVQQVCKLFFPNGQTIFTPRSIMITAGEAQPVMIDDSNFESLQSAISNICCLKTGPMEQTTFNPANDRAREIAEKLMKGRQKVAAQKGGANVSIFSQYLSVLTIGLKMPLSEIMELTVYQLYDLIERYGLYTNWDIDIRSRLAGAKADGKPEDWMKNIH